MDKQDFCTVSKGVYSFFDNMWAVFGIFHWSLQMIDGGEYTETKEKNVAQLLYQAAREIKEVNN